VACSDCDCRSSLDSPPAAAPVVPSCSLTSVGCYSALTSTFAFAPLTLPPPPPLLLLLLLLRPAALTQHLQWSWPAVMLTCRS
jgi:hypothetical protein